MKRYAVTLCLLAMIASLVGGRAHASDTFSVCLKAGHAPSVCSYYPDHGADNGRGYSACIEAGNAPSVCSAYPSQSSPSSYSPHDDRDDNGYAACIGAGSAPSVCSAYPDDGTDGGSGYSTCIRMGNAPSVCSAYPSHGTPDVRRERRHDQDRPRPVDSPRDAGRTEESAPAVSPHSEPTTNTAPADSGPTVDPRRFSKNACLLSRSGLCRYSHPTVTAGGTVYVLTPDENETTTARAFCQLHGKKLVSIGSVGCDETNVCHLSGASLDESGSLYSTVAVANHWGAILSLTCK